MMTKLIRTNSDNEDFRALVLMLDVELAERDGDEHSFYAQFNKIDMIKNVVVGYREGQAVSCGAFKEFPPGKEFPLGKEFPSGKEFEPGVAEVKRMFTKTEFRGLGIAGAVLAELERWAGELGFKECILETGKKQPEAIGLYQKSGYELIPNYGQYAGMDNSVCMKKAL